MISALPTTLPTTPPTTPPTTQPTKLHAALSTTLPTLGQATRAALTPWRLPLGAVLQRFDEVVPRSAPLVVVTVAAVGCALADQAARQALRLLGDQSFIGPEYIVLGVEEFGPLVVALTLSLRVGAGFAAEVATLQSESTLDAMALFGEEPARRVLAPMGFALLLGAVALGLLGFVAWELAGMVTLMLRSGVSPFTFFHPEAVRGAGVVLMVVKCAAAGAIVFATATRAGLGARGGAVAVGDAATKAVVSAVLGCLLMSAALDMLYFLARSPGAPPWSSSTSPCASVPSPSSTTCARASRPGACTPWWGARARARACS